MAEFAKHAVNFAKQGFKIKLDFSDNSIKALEKILGVFYNGFTPEHKPTEDELQKAAAIWGLILEKRCAAITAVNGRLKMRLRF